MNTRRIRILLCFNLFAVMSATGTVRYVDLNSINPTPPYTNWSTAATTIQEAVVYAEAGDQVLVTNGVYRTGGYIPLYSGEVGHRVFCGNGVAIQSVNGPEYTSIEGFQPGGTNGAGAIRCVSLSGGASLSGFTVTNGATLVNPWPYNANGGGVYCASLNEVISNCVIVGNSAYNHGGGVYQGTVRNCTVVGNTAAEGGGAHTSTLNNCTINGNVAQQNGGGAYLSTLQNCSVTGNSAGTGGGVYLSTLRNCTVIGNTAGSEGGACAGTLYNSIVYFNKARFRGNNYDDSCAFTNSCTTPLPTNGVGNIASDPQLASISHLSATSPCIGLGSVLYTSGLDIDGEPWANPPSIGCDEFRSGSVTGALSAAVLVSYTSVAVGWRLGFQAHVEGRVSASRWDFGDGTVISNQPFATHAWAEAGDYVVALRAYSESCPAGVSATVTVHVVEPPVHYVTPASPLSVPPYASWATAATNIQDAVDATTVVGALVLVSNGVYNTGTRAIYGMSNRLAVTKPLEVRSVNGPGVTRIVGHQVPETNYGLGAIRCVYLTNGARLSGFTLTNGATQAYWSDATRENGGGAWCESVDVVISNCVITGNSAHDSGGGVYFGTLYNCVLTHNSARVGGGACFSDLYTCTLSSNSASSGGGAYYGVLNNCLLSSNSASWAGGAGWGTLNNCLVTANSAEYGGGTGEAILNNCTLTGNWARDAGGGAHRGTLNNCVVYFNKVRLSENNYDISVLNYSCTTPLPANGVSNITDDPQLASASHLSANSPCIGAGSALHASGLDIDGEPWANPPSIGCDEFRSGSVTGALSAAIVISYTNVSVGFGVALQGLIEGRVSNSRWDFGDGTVISNQPFATHAWAEAGDYVVELRAYNESYPAGVSATVTVHVVLAPVHYVAWSSSSPVAPYGSWATAATNIQDAVDAATVPGAVVLVSNGVYQTGARGVFGVSNRVAVTKPLEVRSVNGPGVTRIVGYQTPGTTNGPEAIRCVYLTNGAMLSGFTLTNGATGGWGGGVMCESTSESVSNCVIVGNSAFQSGGGAFRGTLRDCTLTGNSAGYGGGATEGALVGCTLTGNLAYYGGGANECNLAYCTLRTNSASETGGGSTGGILGNCTLEGNWARYGGGATGGTLNNSLLKGNSAQISGGGGSGCNLNNCAVIGNSGGGTDGGVLNNCTVIGNSVYGVQNGALTNCIVYYNTPTNISGNAVLNYCCTTPLRSGVSNLSADPEFAGNWHLSAGSPCRAAGSASGATGLDMDGEPWANPPSIGCDEFYSGSATGALTVAINSSYTNAAVGLALGFEAWIEGRVSASRWDFGNGAVSSNRTQVAHAWSQPGDYVVELRAYSDTYPLGIATNVTVQIADPLHYVSLNNAGATPPYTSWATAAGNIQEAVNVAVPGGLVLVSNGVYQTGATMVDNLSSRVAVTRPLRLQSVNGPSATVISGQASVRCVYLTNGSTLSGFTLTNGATTGNGGGLYCKSADVVVSNCIIIGNSGYDGGGAYNGTLYGCTLKGNSSRRGGGASEGTLYNCVITANRATAVQFLSSTTGRGGGTYDCKLVNCTLAGNDAQYHGGGAHDGWLTNCIAYYNTAGISGNNYYQAFRLQNCCTTPAGFGSENISVAPLFVNTNQWSNLRLQSTSPCINSGANASALPGTDLDGNPRVGGGTVDIGAYEFPAPTSVISYAFLKQYGLPLDGSADAADPDGDLLNNWQEWVAGTVPTSQASALRLLAPEVDPAGLTVSWQSVNTRTYFLERASDLEASLSFAVVETNIPGKVGTTSFIDTNATGPGRLFYRVGVQQ